MPAAIIEDLVRHKWHANAAYLAAVDGNEAARRDDELRTVFHHILIANRFWLFLTLARDFDGEAEGRVPDSLDPLLESYRQTEALEMEWLSRCNDAELDRELVTPHFRGRTFTVSQAMIQTIMHSHGHRTQSAIKLRNLGITPPPGDFILWVMNRPSPEWPRHLTAKTKAGIR